MSDVVVLLPGIGGSRLTQNGKDVWAMSAGAVGRALASLGHSVEGLAIEKDSPSDERLPDGVEAPSLLPDLSIVPGLDWRIDGYGVIDTTLQRQFDLRIGQNLFHFPYDWRRDNRAHASRLAGLAEQWLEDWKRTSGNTAAKLVLIGHSMGGLVARYFLECLEGWRATRALITFGTPYSGSLNALDFLVNGYEKKIGPFTFLDLTETMRTWTSVFQLLPVYQCVDLGDGALRRLGDLNSLRTDSPTAEMAKLNASLRKRALALLNHLPKDKLESALAFHREIEHSVTENSDSRYEGTGGYDIRALIGEFQPTKQSGVVTYAHRLETLEDRSGKDEGGDGTVPGLSSVPRELFAEMRNVAFVPHRHSALQNADSSLTQVHGILRGMPKPEFFFAGLAKVALHIGELFNVDEPLRIRTRCDTPKTPLKADVVKLPSNITVASHNLGDVGPDWLTRDLPPLAAGDYRLIVTGDAAVDRVSDVFSVVDSASAVDYGAAPGQPPTAPATSG